MTNNVFQSALGNIALASQVNLVSTNGQSVRFRQVNRSVSVNRCHRIARTGIKTQTTGMRCRLCSLHSILLLCNYCKRSLLWVAVGLAGLYNVRTFAQLGLPSAIAHVLTLEPDFSTVINVYRYVTKVIGHIALLNINQTKAGIVVSSNNERGLTLEAVLQGTNGVTTVVQVLVVNGRLTHVFAINVDG